MVTTFSYTARAVKKKKKPATTQLKEIDIRATRTLYANKCVSFWPRGVRRTTSTHADIHRENGKKKNATKRGEEIEEQRGRRREKQGGITQHSRTLFSLALTPVKTMT